MRADMSPARCHEPAALVPSSLLVVLMTAPGAEACNATCKRDFARCMATQCGAGVGREACRRRCKPAVGPDGSGIVFEVNDSFSIDPPRY